MICPECDLPMREYNTAGHTWWKCLSPFCGKIITDREVAITIKSDNCRSEREKLIDKIKEINEKHRNDPESIKRKQEIYRQLSTLTSEDLSKRVTSSSDIKRSKQ